VFLAPAFLQQALGRLRALLLQPLTQFGVALTEAIDFAPANTLFSMRGVPINSVAEKSETSSSSQSMSLPFTAGTITINMLSLLFFRFPAPIFSATY